MYTQNQLLHRVVNAPTKGRGIDFPVIQDSFDTFAETVQLDRSVYPDWNHYAQKITTAEIMRDFRFIGMRLVFMATTDNNLYHFANTPSRNGKSPGHELVNGKRNLFVLAVTSGNDTLNIVLEYATTHHTLADIIPVTELFSNADFRRTVDFAPDAPEKAGIEMR